MADFAGVVKIRNLPDMVESFDTDLLVVDQPDATRKLTAIRFMEDHGIMRYLTFVLGGTLVSQKDRIYDGNTGIVYVWNGEYPKTVPANSVPDSTGGVSETTWVAVDQGGDSGAVSTFDTVSDMKAATKLRKGTLATTKGYHKSTGHGGAEYDVWDLSEYRAAIGNASWSPDGSSITVSNKTHYAGGDHLLQNNLVAILRYNMLWAGQLGLEDPVKDEDDFIENKVEHDFGLKKAVDYAKKELSFDKSISGEDGVLVRRNIVLHIEQGNYVVTKTCWIGANVLLCGGDTWGCGSRDVNIIPLKPKYGGSLDNYTRGFMFIFNGNENLLPTPEIPKGSTPAENIYIAPYVGGMSSICLSNYETEYGLNPDGTTNWYAPNYLKGIKGSMVFGGGLFQSCTGDRVNIFAHRPGVDWLDYYTDAWQIIDYKCNTPLENEEYQLDFNGSGDVIKVDGVQFPVNHPPANPTPDTPFPNGEYPNGVVKGIRLHNWASWDIRPPGEGGSQESINYVGAGMQITRVINGDISVFGYRQVNITAWHSEFGQLNLHQGSASLKDCYFSKITGAAYNSINCYTGQYGGVGAQLIMEGCEFHRGFDGAHLPVEDGYYDLVVNNNYTVVIRDSFQGWDTAGSNQQVGITVGYFTDTADTTVIPLPGWNRWSPYLSAEARIVRGKLVTQNREIMWNGFEGIQGALCVASRSPLSWDLEKGQTFYYYAQYLADIGDSTVSPSFIPLGKNQRERNVLDEDGNDTGVRYEAEVYVKPDEIIDDGIQEPYLTHYRPILSFYGENETSDSGYVRLYRGKSPYQYTEYVDLPLMQRATVDDYGTTCFGRKWVTNPIAIDTNTDLSARKRNILPLTGNDYTRYNLQIRAGYPLLDSVEVGTDFYNRPELLYFGTGGWTNAETMAVIRASNKSVQAIEEGVMNSVAIFDRPFTGPVWATLPVSGAWNWNNTKRLKVTKGTIARIVRTKDSLITGETKTDKPLWVQVSKADGTNVEAYNVGPGEVITAIYDEKDVLVGTEYVSQGEWIIVNHVPAQDEIPEYLYIEPEDGDFVFLTPTGVKETVAIYDFVNTADLYASVKTSSEIGNRVTITRSSKQTGSLFVLVQDDAGNNEHIINITQTDSTISLIHKKDGWAITDATTTNVTSFREMASTQYADISPQTGILNAYYVYSNPISSVSDDIAILRLEHVYGGDDIPAGTYVKVFRSLSATYEGTLSIIIRQTKDGVTESDLATISAPGQFCEFLYDGTNWKLVGSTVTDEKAPFYGAFNDPIKYMDAATYSGRRLFVKLTSTLSDTDAGYFTLDDAMEVGTEVYISTATSGNPFNIQTPSGTLCTLTGFSWATIIKVIDGTGTDKWLVQHG